MDGKVITFSEMVDIRIKMIHLECALDKYGMKRESGEVFRLATSLLADYDTDHSSYQECLFILKKYHHLTMEFDNNAKIGGKIS